MFRMLLCFTLGDKSKSLMVVIGGDPEDIGMDIEVFDLGNPSR